MCYNLFESKDERGRLFDQAFESPRFLFRLMPDGFAEPHTFGAGLFPLK
jgi:hypothetical protein